MESGPEDKEHRLVTFRRSLKLLRQSYGEGEPVEIQLVRDHLLGFVQKLQARYPFNFAKAYRNLTSELHREVQEKLVTHFLFGAAAELTSLEFGLRDRVWTLGALLSKQIGKGGENFWPHEFNPEEKALAEEIREANFHVLLHKAEELSLAMNFRMGPMNSAEHVIIWCFRYAGQLLKAAKWESIHPNGQPEEEEARGDSSPASFQSTNGDNPGASVA